MLVQIPVEKLDGSLVSKLSFQGKASDNDGSLKFQDTVSVPAISCAMLLKLICRLNGSS